MCSRLRWHDYAGCWESMDWSFCRNRRLSLDARYCWSDVGAIAALSAERTSRHSVDEENIPATEAATASVRGTALGTRGSGIGAT